MKQCFSLDPEMIPFEKTCKRVDKSTHSLPPKYDIEDRVGAQQKLLFVKGKEEYKQEFSEILQSRDDKDSLSWRSSMPLGKSKGQNLLFHFSPWLLGLYAGKFFIRFLP